MTTEGTVNLTTEAMVYDYKEEEKMAQGEETEKKETKQEKMNTGMEDEEEHEELGKEEETEKNKNSENKDTNE